MNDGIFLNGVDGATGSYLTRALSVEEVAGLARGEPLALDQFDELRARHEGTAKSLGVGFGVDVQDLSQTGWGVIFSHDELAPVRDAIAPILELRAAEAGERYKEFVGAHGYRPGDTARTWLARQGSGPGQAQVGKVPYYLLIVGNPERIPFRFQFELSINYAVGRIEFDSVDAYHHYAQTVAVFGEKQYSVRRQVCLFGVRNRGDQATSLSTDHLVVPLADALEKNHAEANWDVQRLCAADASKERLASMLNGQAPPALLFTASHGMGFPRDHPLQLRHQGALLCQDWPGPLAHLGPIPSDYYLSGDDIADGARLNGMIAFHFACYGVGTPRFDDYSHRGNVRDQIAPRAFLATLPQKLLSAPAGGALAVVGHVERAWGYSFMWPGVGGQTQTFENCLGALMAGSRLGAAMDAFALRHADLAVSLNGELEDIKFGAAVNPVSLANLWTANNDARSYAVIGDPAVRLPS